jgi:hypothetical protein
MIATIIGHGIAKAVAKNTVEAVAYEGEPSANHSERDRSESDAGRRRAMADRAAE